MPTLFEFLPIGAYRSSPDGKQLRANAALVKLNGYDSEAQMLAAVNSIGQEWYVDPHRRSEFMRHMEEDGSVVNFVSEIYRHKTRERIWIREAAHAVRDEAGVLVYYEGTVEDITDSHLNQQALAVSEERWKLALDSTGDGVWDWYIQTGDEFFSKRCKEIYGYAEDEIPNRADAFDGRTHPDDVEQMERDRADHFNGKTPVYSNEHRIRCKDGSWKWVLTRGIVIARDADGQPLRMVGTHSDITERKEAEALVWQQANFDPLTGLPNRRMLRQRLEESLVRSQAQQQALAVIFVDLDHFKEVNDSLGHESGDLLLIEAARRIQQCVGERDTVARMGGDEFTILLNGANDLSALETTLQHVLLRLSSAFQVRSEQVFVSASLGVAMYPADAAVVEDLFKHADQALYVAKGAGRNRVSFYTPALQEAAQVRLRLATDLRTALTEQQFEVVYQPIVHLASGHIRKAEALLRWHHPTRGLISPSLFIGIAESNGTIINIGEWVFRQAAHQAQRWQSRFHAQFEISVNASPVQFHHQGARPQWSQQLQTMGLRAGSVAIEITEGVLLDDNEEVATQLADLRAGGCCISLDDFGTGYSSLTYLQRYPIDTIKIDQSFVRNLQPGSTDLALCKAIIVMAHELGMRVVAEGVETQAQRDLLHAAGCDFGQGYWFAKPMSVQNFEAFMAG
jgi:diguanylate cyclase (GGDEF)-like protein/PAS domain S-box-containing protein